MTMKITMWGVLLAILSNLLSTPLGQPEYALNNPASSPGKAKDCKTLRKQPEMGEPFLNRLGTISVPGENLF